MSDIAIFQTDNNETRVEVHFDDETFWLNRHQISELFDRDIKTIGKHINNIFKEGELDKDSVVVKNATTASDGKTYNVEYYNLDLIISVGYRVNSKRGTQFRIWATQRLKEYLVDGYSINEKRLNEKNIEIKKLKSGINLLRRTIEKKVKSLDEVKNLAVILDDFSEGLSILDDYDHENLDKQGKRDTTAIELNYNDFMKVIDEMKNDFSSDIFGKEKDDSFKSSIGQIYQSFDNKDLYPSLEKKAAMLLYLIVKNHSFVDGNKRIAAACFLYFLDRNKMLYDDSGNKLISNDALASLTLLIAESNPKEKDVIIQIIVTVLNRLE